MVCHKGWRYRCKQPYGGVISISRCTVTTQWRWTQKLRGLQRPGGEEATVAAEVPIEARGVDRRRNCVVGMFSWRLNSKNWSLWGNGFTMVCLYGVPIWACSLIITLCLPTLMSYCTISKDVLLYNIQGVLYAQSRKTQKIFSMPQQCLLVLWKINWRCIG